LSNLVVPWVGEVAFASQIQAALAALIAAVKLKVKLYKNNFSPVGATVPADFTEADFTGYAAQNVPPLTPVFLNDSNQAEFDATAINIWTATDAVSPNTIYGYYVEDTTAGPVLLWAEKFDTPVDMTTGGKTLILLLRLVLASMF
jgi:hypothetical protein